MALCDIPYDKDSLLLLIKENANVIQKEAKKCGIASEIVWEPMPLFFREDGDHFEGYTRDTYNEQVRAIINEGNVICNEFRLESKQLCDLLLNLQEKPDELDEAQICGTNKLLEHMYMLYVKRGLSGFERWSKEESKRCPPS